MALKIYIVNLSEEEENMLLNLTKSGKASARAISRAKILLQSNKYPDWSDKKIAEGLLVSKATVLRARKKCIEKGIDGALYDKKRDRIYERKFDARSEAELVILACSKVPEGHSVWTMQMLADEMVRLQYVDSVSDETVRRTLKKMKLNRGRLKVG